MVWKNLPIQGYHPSHFNISTKNKRWSYWNLNLTVKVISQVIRFDLIDRPSQINHIKENIEFNFYLLSSINENIHFIENENIPPI